MTALLDMDGFLSAVVAILGMLHLVVGLAAGVVIRRD